jgi:predicted DsbA family dithiol-disulfide isomerase
MKIEVWTDIICPWCGLGLHRLKQAVARLPATTSVELQHHSFQLDEQSPVGTTEPVRDYFGEQKSIFDVDSLAALAPRVGLDAEAARETLGDRTFAEQVLADGREARRLGASGVPFTVIDRQRGFAGAQPVDAILSVLRG